MAAMSQSPSPPPSSTPPPPAPQRAGLPRGPRASFWKRFVAAIVDSLLLGLISNVLLRALVGQNASAVLSILIGIAYYVYLEGSPSGQTLGKRAIGIRVISFTTGGPAGFGAATIRYFARILSALPLLLGYFWMLWDDEKQTWHDKLSSTVVVPVSDYPVDKWPG